MKSLSFALLALVFVISCGNSTPENTIQSQVKALMESNKYTEALNLLQTLPASEEITKLIQEIRVENGNFLLNAVAEAKKLDVSNPENLALLVKAHLDYAIFLEYYGEHLAMRDRMTGSLAHFRKALQLDPKNEKAIAEIAQIEGIYSQMGRPVPQDIAE